MSEKNKALTRRFMEEVFDKKNLAAVDEFIAADAVDHNPTPGQAPGSEGVKQLMGMFLAAFPDLYVGVEDLIAEGDLGGNAGLDPRHSQRRIHGYRPHREADRHIGDPHCPHRWRQDGGALGQRR